MNWTAIIIALVTSFPPTIMAFVAWRESRKVHLTVNSRMTELLETTRGESKAAGKAEGKIEERNEVAERANGKT